MSDTSVAAATLTAQRGLPAEARFLVQVSRPGLWSTTALLYLLPLGRADFVHSGRLWLGLVFVLFPLGLLLYGVNDLSDAEADQLNPRKGTYMFGSRGAPGQLAALKWQIVVAQLPFLAAFYLLVGPRILEWYGILLLAVGVYNAPRVTWKFNPPFDVLIQASYLLVFVLSSWLNKVPQLPWQTFVFGALFAMHSHVFGEVMDIEPDQLSGRKTTATVIGRVPAKLLTAAFLGVETWLVRFYFRDWIVAVFLALGALWFVLDATLFWKDRRYLPKETIFFASYRLIRRRCRKNIFWKSVWTEWRKPGGGTGRGRPHRAVRRLVRWRLDAEPRTATQRPSNSAHPRLRDDSTTHRRLHLRRRGVRGNATLD